MIIRDFSDFPACDFYLDTLSVVEKTVLPPVPFVCSTGDVLYERFFYITQGKIIFDIDNTVKEFSAGDILYLPYDVTYSSRWDTAEEGAFISINFTLRSKYRELVSLSDTIELFYHDTAHKYFPLFQEIANSWNNGSLGYRFLNHSQFYNILYNLYKDKTRSELRTSYNKIYKSVIYLDNNYLSDVTTSELASMCGLKDCMFRRVFKQVKGMSPMKYRNTLRINKASEMLRTGDFSVLEAMLLTGFNDTSYFYKLFKRQFAKAPSEFIPQ